MHATKKLLRLVHSAAPGEDEQATTMLGAWYATVLFWRPRVVLMVNETTLLPVLLPLAPARSLPDRIAEQITNILAAHNASDGFVAAEREQMQTVGFTATRNRSVVGVMTDFTRLAEFRHADDPGIDLQELALQLARTPCSPLHQSHVSPDRELTAFLKSRTT